MHLSLFKQYVNIVIHTTNPLLHYTFLCFTMITVEGQLLLLLQSSTEPVFCKWKSLYSICCVYVVPCVCRLFKRSHCFLCYKQIVNCTFLSSPSYCICVLYIFVCRPTTLWQRHQCVSQCPNWRHYRLWWSVSNRRLICTGNLHLCVHRPSCWGL